MRGKSVLKLIYVLNLALLATGCTSNKINQNKLNSLNYTVYKQPIYGLLKKSENGYQFVKFKSNSPEAYTEPWVDIFTARPMWNTNSQRCGKGLIKDRKESVSDCSEIAKEELFLESKFDKGDAVIRVLGAPLTMGLTLTGASFDVTFNNDEYTNAYNNAIKRIDENLLKSINNELTSLINEYENRQSRYNSISVDNGFKIRISDQSGLFSNQFNVNNLVTLHKNELSKVTPVTASDLTGLLTAVQEQHTRLKHEWEAQDAVVDITCHQGPMANVSFTIQCPSKSALNEGQIIGTAELNVKSVNYYKVLPKNYKSYDDVIYLSFDGQNISLSNKSDKFVTIDSIAFYYNGKIANRYKLGLELSPNSSLVKNDELHLTDFPIDWSILSYANTTKNKAINTTITFGFAVKYRIQDASHEKTLYSTTLLSG